MKKPETIFTNFDLYMSEVKQRNKECIEMHGGLDFFNIEEKIIDTNINYFKDCWENQLSPYKALTFLIF